jgi:hypothetical protein
LLTGNGTLHGSARIRYCLKTWPKCMRASFMLTSLLWPSSTTFQNYGLFFDAGMIWQSICKMQDELRKEWQSCVRPWKWSPASTRFDTVYSFRLR